MLGAVELIGRGLIDRHGDGIGRAVTTPASVKGERFRPLVIVAIDEVKSGDFAAGGQPITIEEVEAIVEGRVKPG